MIVYLVAAAQALYYLGAVPLCLAVCVQTRRGPRFAVGLSAFERRFALRSALRRIRSGQPGKRRRKGRSPSVWLYRMLRHLRADEIRLRGTVCLGDAAATAMVCGGLRGLESALAGAAPRVRLRVDPVFQGAPDVDIQGMIRVRTGQIIRAALRGALKTAKERIAQWTSAQSNI